MKIKQGEAVKATIALQGIRQKPLNSVTAYRLFKIKKALADIIEFQAEQEVSLAKELGGETSEHGIVFKDETARNEYNKRHKELTAVECEVDLEKQDIPFSDLPPLSMEEIEALEPFVNFID